MFICRINHFTLWSYQEYLYTNIHLYRIFSCSPFTLRQFQLFCSKWGKIQPFYSIYSAFLWKAGWFDRKAQTQSFILSLTVYWSCFRETTSARRKHESIIYIYVYIPESTVLKQKYKHVICFTRVHSYMFTIKFVENITHHM